MSVLATLRYTNTVDDVVAFAERHTQDDLRRAMNGWCLFIPFAAFSVAVAHWVGGGATPLSSLLFSLGWAAAFSLLFVWFYRPLARRIFRESLLTTFGKGRNAAVYCEHSFELTEDLLIERTPAGETRIRLDCLEGVETTEEYLYIYVQALSAHLVPQGAILEGDYDAFYAALIAAIKAAGGNAGPLPA